MTGPMTESLSLFCGVAEFALAAHSLSARGLQVEHAAGSRDQIVASCGIHTLRFSPMHWTGPGGRLAKTILGTLAYARRISQTDPAAAEDILPALSSCRLLIGITGTEGSLSHSLCQATVYDVAEKLGSLTFDGAIFYSANGAVLLSP